MIKDVAAALVATFAENLAGSLSADGQQEPGLHTDGNGAPAGAQPSPPAPPPSPDPDVSLPVGQIVAGVVAARVKDDRTRALLSVILALLLFGIVRRVLRRA